MKHADVTYEIVKSYLDEEDLCSRPNDDRRLIRTSLMLNTARYELLGAVAPEPTAVTLFLHLPFIVAEEKRIQAAKTVVRANVNLGLGRFDLNMTDETHQFESMIPLTDSECSQQQFLSEFRYTVAAVEKYFRAFGESCLTLS